MARVRRKKKYELQHGLVCPFCKDEIFSNHRHDFKYCKCGEIFIDGGFDYMRSGGPTGGPFGGPVIRELPIELKISNLASHTALGRDHRYLTTRAALECRTEIDAEIQIDLWEVCEDEPQTFKFKYQYNQFKDTLMLIEEQLVVSLVSSNPYIRRLAEYIKVGE